MVFSYLVEIEKIDICVKKSKSRYFGSKKLPEILRRQIELLGRLREALSLPKRWLKIKACLA